MDNVNLDYDIKSYEDLDKYFDLVKYREINDKTMVLSQKAIDRLKCVITSIKKLLDIEEAENYQITIKQFIFYPNKITISLEAESFGACREDFLIFKNIINNIDSFDSISMVNGNVKYYFGLNDIYTP